MPKMSEGIQQLLGELKADMAYVKNTVEKIERKMDSQDKSYQELSNMVNTNRVLMEEHIKDHNKEFNSKLWWMGAALAVFLAIFSFVLNQIFN